MISALLLLAISLTASPEVFPPSVELTGPRAEQRIGAPAEATLAIANPKIARIEGGIVRPVADGETVLTVTIGGKSVPVPVKVKNAQRDVAVSFVREVEPVLTRYGCNMGACHGAQHGKGGFRLSLFGFDPEFDHVQIVQSAKGRRVVLSDPERSILLQKPTLVMDHAGGERLRLHGKAYQLLQTWLAEGASGPAKGEPTLKQLQVWPARRQMTVGQHQQVLVRAEWSDGTYDDVTELAQFDALNESIAAVTPEGKITARGVGETHVMVRFGGQARVVQITLPYGETSAFDFPAANFIDEKLAAKWRELGLSPSALADDATFLRRVYLDAIGTLPTAAEVRAFLDDSEPNKRDKIIDKLLDRPEFVDFWALKWGDLLRINRDLLQEKGMWSFHNWVRASLRDNKPLDQMAREILTAEGSTFTEGPANFFLAARNPADWSETAVQLFMGVRLQCAKCHQHPFEKWSQDDYWSMAAFFARLGTKNSQEFGLFGRETVIHLRPTGEVRHPRKGTVLPPQPLGETVAEDPIDRRRALGAWLTAKGNPFFARNFVNRFWAYTMGRGLVEPIDDMRETNPASIPPLLDALAADFEANGYNLKHLLRTIFRSRAYQLASTVAEGNKADATNVYHTRYTQKRLTAEQLADAIDEVTGVREKYVGLPLGTRAIQLPDTRVRSFLLDVFGRPPRQITCECERTSQPNLAQALHLLNGDTLNRKIEAPTGRVANLLKDKQKPEWMVDELYLTALGRLPTQRERGLALQGFREAGTPREGAQDLLWVLVNRREFQFNR
jgi:hypothetical protein